MTDTAPADPPRPAPLAGVRVLDLSRALAGPFCTMILGDLGADVVKAEALPGGDATRGWGPFDRGTSVYFLSANRNKRSLALDVRDPRGTALLRELAGRADVVVENFKPGTTRAMGLDWETLGPANPRLIHASVTGFGRGGPYEDLPGVDQIAQGMSGWMSLTGQEGPTRVGVPVADMAAGMWAALGVQAALLRRAVDGRGGRVETSLLGALVGMLGVQGQRALSLGETPGVAGNDHPTIAPYGTFRAADGAFNMAAATPEMWRRLCRLLDLDALADDPDFADNEARVRNRAALRARLESRFALRGRLEWTRDLAALGLPAGPIFDLADVFADPHVRGAGMVETARHSELGVIELMTSPLRLDAGPDGAAPTIRLPPPTLGEHSRAALADFGVAAARIEALIAAGVVRQRA